MLLGAQRPALWTAPPRHRDIEPSCPACGVLAKPCGTHQAARVLEWAAQYWDLDEWQQWYLFEALGTKPNGQWASRNNALIVPRQNGKGTILEVRELAGLYLLGEESVVHTAQMLPTSLKHFLRVLKVVESNPELDARVLKVNHTNGREGIWLKPDTSTIIFGPGGKQVKKDHPDPPALEFAARSKSGQRGWTSDCIVYDEAMFLTKEQIGASKPSLSSRGNVQTYMMGSAGFVESDQLAIMHEHIVDDDHLVFGAEWGGLTLHDKMCPVDRRLGRKLNNFVYECKDPTHTDRDDEKAWAKANPSYGLRVDDESTFDEITGMDVSEFNRERLNIGEWPAREAPWKVIDAERWEQLTVEFKGTVPPVVFAVDVEEDSVSAAIGASWMDGTGKTARIIVTNPRNCVQQGTEWVLPMLKKLNKQWHPIGIVVPKDGAAAGLGDDIEKAFRQKVVRAGSLDQAAAHAFFTQSVDSGLIGHPPKDKAAYLYVALGSAETKPVGDGGKALRRKDSETGVAPATTAELAAWYLNRKRRNYDVTKSMAGPS